MQRVSLDASPRKMPIQRRSKATVDAIVTAAAQVLLAHGYEGATTARVAERAGVSIGSLYQYFPNKEALVAALIERHADEMVAIVGAAVADAMRTTLADGLRAFIDAGAAAHRLNPALHKILHEQVPRVGRLAKVLDTARRITLAIEEFLRAHADELRPGLDPAIAAVVVETSMEALVHKAVIEQPELLAEGVLVREVFCLVSAYLTGSAPSPGRRRR